ncbi:MAG: GTPase HflX [Armatimonadia bacterium]|nr:GTPase HflX [Armatimonadia bacterium]
MAEQQRFDWVDIRAEKGLAQQAERAIVLGMDPGDGTFERTFAEMEELARNAWLDPVAMVSQKLSKPDPKTYLGKGKVQEAKELLVLEEATVVATSDPLTPAQQRNMEKILDTPVVDRTEVILDIFAHRARSREGKVQVELAQLEYRLPRLMGRGEVLSRLAGGIGTRGPGETKLEVDRRRIRNRISRLRKEIEEIGKRRRMERDSRDGVGPFRVALVGYTNAGKSTLLNRLAGAETYVDNMLFATLDATTKGVELPGGRRVVVTDTVGFIDRLPTSLIAAFSSTLEEARDADLLLHVVDAGDPQAAEKIGSVLETLDEIGALDLPIVTVLNKCDTVAKLDDGLPSTSEPDVLKVSARTGDGIEELIQAIDGHAEAGDRQIEAHLPFDQMSLVSELHERGSLLEQEYTEDGIRVVARVPEDLRGRLEEFAVKL